MASQSVRPLEISCSRTRGLVNRLSNHDAKSTCFDEFLTYLSAALLSRSALRWRSDLDPEKGQGGDTATDHDQLTRICAAGASLPPSNMRSGGVYAAAVPAKPRQSPRRATQQL